jgi:hypothetical protein
MATESDLASEKAKPPRIPAAPGSAAVALAAADEAYRLGKVRAPVPGQGPPAAPGGVQPILGTGPETIASAIRGVEPPAAFSAAPPPDHLPASVPAPASDELGFATVPTPVLRTSDEEQTLLTVIRLIDRSSISEALSPVERALIAGARAIFEELARECEQMLASGPPASPPRPLSPEDKATGADSREVKPAKPRAPRKTARVKAKQPAKSEQGAKAGQAAGPPPTSEG